MSEQFRLGNKSVKGTLAADPELVKSKDGRDVAAVTLVETLPGQQAGQVEYSVGIAGADDVDYVLNNLQAGDELAISGQHNVVAEVQPDTQDVHLENRIIAQEIEHQEPSAVDSNMASRLAWIQREVPWRQQEYDAILDRDDLVADPGLAEEVVSAMRLEDQEHWATASILIENELVEEGYSPSQPGYDDAVNARLAEEITTTYSSAEVQAAIDERRAQLYDQFVRVEATRSDVNIVNAAPDENSRAVWDSIRQDVISNHQRYGVAVDESYVNAEVADRVLSNPSWDAQQVAESMVRHNQQLATGGQSLSLEDIEDMTPQQVKEYKMALDVDARVDDQLEREQEEATLDAGADRSLNDFMRDYNNQGPAQSEDRSVGHAGGVDSEYLMAQKLTELPPRPGAAGPSM